MRIGRTLPPAAAPIEFGSLMSSLRGIFHGQRELERFERELKDHFEVRHCFLVSSGKAALNLILLALKELSPVRDEVILPAFTCYSVPSSVVRASLRISLCDLEPDSFNFDFSQIAALTALPVYPVREPTGPLKLAGGSDANHQPVAGTRRILAVVPTHLYGYPADMQRLRRSLGDPGIAIVEDAAQAMGEATPDGKAGTLGDAGFFSLARGKVFSTVEGGVILTDRDDIAKVLHRLVGDLPQYGLFSRLKLVLLATALMLLMRPWLFWIPRGMPFLKLGETLFETDFPIRRMSSFQAGLTRNWQGKLVKLREGRKARVNRWMELFERCGSSVSYLRGSRSLGLIRLPVRIADRVKRQALMRESNRRGLGIMPVYPTSINAIPELKGLFAEAKFPVAEACALDLVTVPTHGYVSDGDMTRLHRLVSSVVK